MASALLASAEVLAGYLDEVELPEPALVEVRASRIGQAARVIVQVRGYERTAREQAADLVAWFRPLRSAAVDAWRQPNSETVFVTVSGTLTHQGAEVPLEVYASMTERGPFTDLSGGTRPSSVQEIQRWALGEPPLGSVVLTCPGCETTDEPTAADLDSGHTGCPRCGGPTVHAEITAQG